jgi:hypothetical protein
MVHFNTDVVGKPTLKRLVATVLELSIHAASNISVDSLGKRNTFFSLFLRFTVLDSPSDLREANSGP